MFLKKKMNYKIYKKMINKIYKINKFYKINKNIAVIFNRIYLKKKSQICNNNLKFIQIFYNKLI